ncbi:hypothetical protein [Pseudomonas sp.]|uniref:hypothetical protein n=1 Tax=Pseudomonas sp. TaxID=306 RepID=UPI0025865B11|nr:hypothetical protein [Pseudomonas sp.]
MSDSGRADALLADLPRDGRGRLKVFLGAAPGVGKTYAMLQAAHTQLRQGVRLLAGVVETHGRAETEALLSGLPQQPLLRSEYRGVMLEEMDLDGLLAAKPQLVLVDELAHSNAPGSRLLVLPNHVCMTAAMYDRYFVIDPAEDGEQAAGDVQIVAEWDRVNGW